MVAFGFFSESTAFPIRPCTLAIYKIIVSHNLIFISMIVVFMYVYLYIYIYIYYIYIYFCLFVFVLYLVM